jgi:hypothetical protein
LTAFFALLSVAAALGALRRNARPIRPTAVIRRPFRLTARVRSSRRCAEVSQLCVRKAANYMVPTAARASSRAELGPAPPSARLR